MVSFVALLFFIFLLWEAMVAQRGIVSLRHIRPSMEWQDVTPLGYHNMPETAVVVVKLDESQKAASVC